MIILEQIVYETSITAFNILVGQPVLQLMI